MSQLYSRISTLGKTERTVQKVQLKIPCYCYHEIFVITRLLTALVILAANKTHSVYECMSGSAIIKEGQVGSDKENTTMQFIRIPRGPVLHISTLPGTTIGTRKKGHPQKVKGGCHLSRNHQFF